jgi:predicted outer membrane protein
MAAVLPLAAGACMGAAALSPGARQADIDAHAFASAVDQSEIQQAMIAQQQGASQGVRDFAARMINDHTSALRTREAAMAGLGMGLGLNSSAWATVGSSNAMNVGSGSMGSGSMAYGSGVTGTVLTSAGFGALQTVLASNAASRPVMDAAPATLQFLQSLSGAAFDPGYLDQQIAAHQYTLDNMDRMLASGMLSPQVMAILRAQRATVASHLQMAQQLRAGM